MALIKIEKSNLPTVSFADAEKIKLGERVFLVGIIFDNLIPQKMVNEGIIQKVSQDSIETNIFDEDSIKGSPLFNIEGSVVGLNIINSQGKVVAIPISKIKEFSGL